MGANDRGEVIINYRGFKVDKLGRGFIAFSPRQARNLARILNKQAREAEK